MGKPRVQRQLDGYLGPTSFEWDARSRPAYSTYCGSVVLVSRRSGRRSLNLYVIGDLSYTCLDKGRCGQFSSSAVRVGGRVWSRRASGSYIRWGDKPLSATLTLKTQGTDILKMFKPVLLFLLDHTQTPPEVCDACIWTAETSGYKLKNRQYKDGDHRPSKDVGFPKTIVGIYLTANNLGSTVPGYDTHTCPFI